MISLTRSFLAVLVLCATVSGRAQEPQGTVPFSCEEGAVAIDVSREPGVRFEPIGRPALLPMTPREFTFASGPIRHVRVYLSATLPEAFVSLASEARLSVVVQTSDGPDVSAPSRWWQLVQAPAEVFGYRRTSESLLFAANAVSGCFGGEDCRFAELAPAGDDTSLLVLGFRHELGGANADNWDLARLVLDFRETTPRVAVAADCGYNQGGGVCTAHDSMNMPRATLSCPWNAAVGDFQCTEVSDRFAHRDFDLLSGRDRRRDGEATTLEGAARQLAGGATGPILVAGSSPVRLVHEAALGRSRVLVFVSAGQFYIAERTPNGLGPLTPVEPRGPAIDASLDRHDETLTGWTRTFEAVQRASELARGSNWMILRLLEEAGSGSSPRLNALVWLGIERRAARLQADALTLVGGSSYGGCAQTAIPWQVSAVRRIRRPFDAEVTVQPPTMESLSGALEWRGSDDENEVRDCRRPGRIRWRDGHFAVEVGDGECATAEEPLVISLDPGGDIRTTPGVKEPR